MKKVLLATTALALSAGVASAEITFSGSARMGVVYTGELNDGKAAVAAVQRKHTAATVAAAGLNVNRIGTAVTAADYADLLEAAEAASAAFEDEHGAVLDDAQGDVDTAQTALDVATLAQDAAAITTAKTTLAAAKTALSTATGAANASDEGVDLAAAAAAVVAATGTPAVDAVANTAADWALNNRMTINIDASTETSSGLTFGGRLRIRSSDGNNASVNGARVYMKSGAIEVAVGNIYGALDSMPGMYNSEVGLTVLADAGVVTNVADGARAWGFDGYSSTGSQMGVEAIYSAGAFTGHLSVTDSDAGSASDRVAAVGAYTMGDWTVALGMQDSQKNTEDKTVLTVGGKIGDYGIGFAAADNDGVQKIALNGSATFGATTVNGFVADDESGTDTAVGLGVSYDVGGAAVMAGVERDAVGVTRADMGVSFSF